MVEASKTLPYPILSFPQTESLKLAMTIEVASANKMFAKGTFIRVGQKPLRSWCAALHFSLSFFCQSWKLHTLQLLYM